MSEDWCLATCCNSVGPVRDMGAHKQKLNLKKLIPEDCTLGHALQEYRDKCADNGHLVLMLTVKPSFRGKDCKRHVAFSSQTYHAIRNTLHNFGRRLELMEDRMADIEDMLGKEMQLRKRTLEPLEASDIFTPKKIKRDTSGRKD